MTQLDQDRSLKLTRSRAAKPRSLHRAAIAALVAAAVIASLLLLLNEPSSGPSFFSTEAWRRFGDLLASFAGRDVADPAYFQASFWSRTLRQTLDTLHMSVLAATLAAAGIIVSAVTFAAFGKRGSRKPSPAAVAIQAAVRLAFTLARSVPEYVWALIIVLVFKPGILAGALALAIHNFGVLGRLTYGAVHSKLASGADSGEAAESSLLALQTAGAGRRQSLLYWALPTYAPELLTLYLYRWEIITRATLVVGFVANAGLGLSLRLALSFRFFTEMAGILLVYLLLVLAVDLISSGLRRLSKLS